MKITVKVKPDATDQPAALVRARLESVAAEAEVEEVFPGLQTGKRAGLVVVSLPDSVSEDDSRAVLRSLREAVDIEYAEPASPRKAR